MVPQSVVPIVWYQKMAAILKFEIFFFDDVICRHFEFLALWHKNVAHEEFLLDVPQSVALKVWHYFWEIYRHFEILKFEVWVLASSTPASQQTSTYSTMTFLKPTYPSLCSCKILSQSEHFFIFFDDVINCCCCSCCHALMMMSGDWMTILKPTYLGL